MSGPDPGDPRHVGDLLGADLAVVPGDGDHAQPDLAQLTTITDVQVVILHLSTVAMLDGSGARALGEIVEQLAERGTTVLLKGASPEHTRLLAAVGTLAPVLAQNHVFTNLADAVAHAREHVARMDHAGDDHGATPAGRGGTSSR